MPLSWNEIRHNAIRFAKDWAGVTREEAEGKSFWDKFFNVAEDTGIYGCGNLLEEFKLAA